MIMIVASYVLTFIAGFVFALTLVALLIKRGI